MKTPVWVQIAQDPKIIQISPSVQHVWTFFSHQASPQSSSHSKEGHKTVTKDTTSPCPSKKQKLLKEANKQKASNKAGIDLSSPEPTSLQLQVSTALT
ncbi:hypothetical protein PRK78_003352 [Emydomyces testavorans]|uniref:Uncharacterized protein n=1 Tax=Emydomyces testavorans TaxID=2070801 RepID=A0AAF0DG15_9EURO|nr:hypothetical protein PRK78_003352 [Emydomyces testavorans]